MNVFENYVEHSESIQDNVAAIAAKEQRRQENAGSYGADIDMIRDELSLMRVAFKDVVYRFSRTLPAGWRVLGNFDDWVAGKACAGFAHGDMQPDAKLMIGGQCKTVLGIELELERLHQLVWQMEP